MVHRAVCTLTNCGSIAAAWKSLFPGITAAHKVGIKINLACGDVPTHAQVVNAIIDGLLSMDLGGQQLPEEHIIVWDKLTSRFCAQTGYTPNYGGPGVQYFGNDSVGFDMARTCSIQHPYGYVSQHHPSLILSSMCDYMINAGVMKDHSEAGIAMGLKNCYGSFDNIGIYQMHQHSYWGDGHSRGEPALNAYIRDGLGDKTKLHVIDGTFGLYTGGPGNIPPYHTPPNWAYNSFLASIDPVALDRVGTIKINEKRALHGVSQLNPSHVYTSAQAPYNLGTDDPAQIDLIEIDASQSQAVLPADRDPRGAVLLAPRPNPAPGACTLRFDLAAAADVELVIADAAGRAVRRIPAGRRGPGTHGVLWDCRDGQGRPVPAGAYFCALRAPGEAGRRRVIVTR